MSLKISASEGGAKKTARHKSCFKGCLWSTLIATICITGLAWCFLHPQSLPNRRSAVSCTCEWARLDPLPVPISEVRIETKGGMFTREFIISFDGPPETLLKWLQSSPGTKDAFAKSTVLKGTHFEIAPGGGAQFAEITISNDGTKISIRSYWS